MSIVGKKTCKPDSRPTPVKKRLRCMHIHGVGYDTRDAYKQAKDNIRSITKHEGGHEENPNLGEEEDKATYHYSAM